MKLPPGGGPPDRASGGQGPVRRQLHDRGRRLPARPGKAEADNDREALNLLARHYLALHDRDKKTVHLENAWKVTQAALAAGKIDRAQKDEAIRRAVELTPKIREALGRAWLEESFTARPERGMEIIAAIGAASTQGLQTHAFDADFRLKSMTLQKLAVEALLRKAPARGKEWARASPCWPRPGSREAEFSYHYDYSTSLGPRMHYDPFGNMYYSNYDPFSPDMMARQRGMPMAIEGRRRRQRAARRRLARLRRRRDQAQVRHRLRQAVPQGQRGRRGLPLHRADVKVDDGSVCACTS